MIIVKAGDTFKKQFQLLDKANIPIDITNISIKSELFTQNGEKKGAFYIEKKLPKNGVFEMTMDKDTTIGLDNKKYLFDIQYSVDDIVVSTENYILKIEKDMTL